MTIVRYFYNIAPTSHHFLRTYIFSHDIKFLQLFQKHIFFISYNIRRLRYKTTSKEKFERSLSIIILSRISTHKERQTS